MLITYDETSGWCGTESRSIESLSISCDEGESRLVEKDLYEGGNVEWECSVDLADWVETHQPPEADVLRVFEFGCGQALPSARLLECWPAAELHLVLQDLNRTAFGPQNKVLNYLQGSGQRQGQVGLVVGPWSGTIGRLRRQPISAEEKFNVILGSETVYREECFEDVEELLALTLAKNGKAFLALKRFYFSLGGGSFPFKRFLEESPRHKWNVSIVKTVDDGRSNLRDVIQVTWAPTTPIS